MAKRTQIQKKPSFADCVKALSRKKKFWATVYAINSLLLHRGVYTRREFERLFVEWSRKELRKQAVHRRSA